MKLPLNGGKIKSIGQNEKVTLQTTPWQYAIN